MSWNQETFLQTFGPSENKNNPLWTQGIMMHEFAHCLDLARDFPPFGEHTYKVASIAPIDARAIDNIETYLSAAEKKTTGLWREAFADIFAIGFWRLIEPSKALEMAKDLRTHRTNNASDDPIHATACWIDASLKKTPRYQLETSSPGLIELGVHQLAMSPNR